MSEYLGQRIEVKIEHVTVTGILHRNVICGDEMWSLETQPNRFMAIDPSKVREVRRV